MKKFLLMAAAALISVSAMAQKDVTDTYITNARLSDGTNGWTVKNFNAPQKGNNTIGYASESYAGWGSLDVKEYSMTQTITLPKGVYRLANYSFFRQGLNFNTDVSKSLAFLKAGDQQVAVATLGSLACNGYANSQAEGANVFDSKMYRNVVEFEIAEDGTEIEIGLVGTFDLKQSWCIAGMFELFDLNEQATEDNPTDVTYAIVNSGFEHRDLTGWTNNGMQTQSNASFAYKAGGYYAEKWQASGALPNCGISQVISGLPAGYYTLNAYASYGGNGAFIFANDTRTPIVVGRAGKYSANVLIKAGEDLTIGYALENGTSNYLCVDRFTLDYYPVDLTDLKNVFASLVSAAEALEAKPMQATILATLQNATSTPEEDEVAYAQAISTLTNAIEFAEESVDLYEQIAAINAKAAALVGDDAAAAYSGVLATYNDGTATATDPFEAAYKEAMKAADPVSDVTGLASAEWKYQSGNVAEQYCPDMPGAPERYQEGAFVGDVLTQTITGLKNGSYKVVLKGGASYTSGRGFEGATGQNHAYFFANDALQSLEVFDRTVIEIGDVETAELICGVQDGTLTFGIQNQTIGANWFVVNLVSIEYISTDLPPVDVTLTVGEAQWATFMAPFAVDVPAGVKAYTTAAEVGAYGLLALNEITTIPANTPVLLNAETPVNTIVSGVSKAESLTYQVGCLVGTYGDLEITEGYVLQKQDKIGFYAVSAENPKTVPANHAYAVAATAGVKVLTFGEVTAIQAVEALTAGKAQIFDLNGRQINKLQKGINIVNGVKVLVK